MFDANIISPEILASLPAGYVLRGLAPTDYDKGYLQCLGELSDVGMVDKATFLRQYEQMKASGTYYVHVLEDTNRSAIVGTATLLVELKFLRQCSRAGHIEDVVVSASERGKKLGAVLINQLRYAAQAVGCYKLILNCTEANAGFYAKCGLQRHDIQMKAYLPPPQLSGGLASKELL